MKKLLLSSIAALFLATGTVHAADPADRFSGWGATDWGAVLQQQQQQKQQEQQQTPPLPPDGNGGPMCPAPQDATGMPTEIPCAQLGVAYDCGQGPHGTEAGEPDEVWINHGHIYSDLNSRTITIHLPNMTARKSRRYPVIRYDLENDEITLDGKPCHPVGG
jgi:hypothetical protein